ncbi:MAG: thioesterase [Candidatus Borkfalkiaceae bacterium]|nr:thioesterase [Clostridia bacterium]MDY6222804.1 thioesterase [Christensenellaceae bacterium]
MERYRHEETFKLGFRDVDFKDELKVSSLLSYFETAASNSAEELGFGYTYLKEHGYAFFLCDIRCILYKSAMLGDIMRVVTWPTPPSFAVFGREFEGYDKSGEKALAATSRWCAVNFSSGKILTAKAFPEQDYTNDTIYDPQKSGVPFVKTLKFLPEEGVLRYSLTVANSEYDHNMHVNNTRYADYCLNCFTASELARRRPESFSVSYVKQCREGDELRFYRKDEEGGVTRICGFNQSGENVVRAEFSFASRDESGISP